MITVRDKAPPTGKCTYNVAKTEDGYWPYKRCNKLGARILNEETGCIDYRCEEHLERLRQWCTVKPQEVLVVTRVNQ